MFAIPRFSLRRLMLCLGVCAILMGGATALTVPPVHTLVLMPVLASFVMLAPARESAKETVSRRFARLKLATHYVTAVAVIGAVGYGLTILFPEIVVPPPPEPAFPTLYFLSGQMFHDVVGMLDRSIAFTAGYAIPAVLASVVGCVLSLLTWRRSRSAKWYLLLNLPGCCFLAFTIVAAVVGY